PGGGSTGLGAGGWRGEGAADPLGVSRRSARGICGGRNADGWVGGAVRPARARSEGGAAAAGRGAGDAEHLPGGLRDGRGGGGGLRGAARFGGALGDA